MSYQKLKLNKRQAQHESISQMGVYIVEERTALNQIRLIQNRPKQWTMRMRSFRTLDNMPNSAVNSVFITYRLSLTQVCPIYKSSQFSATNTRFLQLFIIGFANFLFMVLYGRDKSGNDGEKDDQSGEM